MAFAATQKSLAGSYAARGFLSFFDVGDVQMRIEATAVAPRAERHCRNRRDAVVAVTETDDRGITARHPRAPHGWAMA
jgi:hypothetical protein